MRVVHIVHGKVNPAGPNGISRVVYHLVKHERLQGCDSRVWAVVDGIRKPFTLKRDRFVTVECFPRVRLPWLWSALIDRITLERASIDLAHFHMIWFYDKNIIAKALTRLGVPFIATTHGTYSTPGVWTGKKRLARLFYELSFLRMASAIHALSRDERRALKAYGYSGRVFVVPNGVDPAEIPRRRRRDFFSLKPYAARHLIIWMGVLREDKNLDSLVRAVSLLSESVRTQFVCVLVGPDSEGNARRILALSVRLGCRDNFDYIGPLFGRAKYDAIESGDAFILPSLSEGISLALLDAMACAKPALISSRCGFSHREASGFAVLCEPRPKDLARGLMRLLARGRDWAEMGRIGRRIAMREFSWPRIAGRMVKQYARVVAER